MAADRERNVLQAYRPVNVEREMYFSLSPSQRRERNVLEAYRPVNVERNELQAYRPVNGEINVLHAYLPVNVKQKVLQAYRPVNVNTTVLKLIARPTSTCMGMLKIPSISSKTFVRTHENTARIFKNGYAALAASVAWPGKPTRISRKREMKCKTKMARCELYSQERIQLSAAIR